MPHDLEGYRNPGAVMDQALKPVDVARLMNVTVYTVHEWLRTGELAGIKLRSAWRILPSDLEEFILLRRREYQPKH